MKGTDSNEIAIPTDGNEKEAAMTHSESELVPNEVMESLFGHDIVDGTEVTYDQSTAVTNPCHDEFKEDVSTVEKATDSPSLFSIILNPSKWFA